MRKILFLLLLMPAISNAQFQIGINGGIAHNSLPVGSNPGNSWSTTGSSPYGIIQADYTLTHWQVGIALDITKPSFNVDFNTLKFSNQSGTNRHSISTPEVFGNGKYIIANPATSIKVVANRVLNIHRWQIYGGVQAGYMNGSSKMSENYKAGNDFSDNDGSNGYVIGIQVGTTFYFTKHIGVNAQFNPEYMRVNFASKDGYSFYVLPVSIGVKVRL